MVKTTAEHNRRATDKAQESSGDEGVSLRARILHLLRVYPVISPTMLQNALGPMTKARLWRPVLAELIEEELVSSTSETVLTPSGRYNNYKKLSLTEAGLKEPVIAN